MSIEQALAANTAAIERHTEVLQDFMKTAKAPSVASGKAGAGKPAAGRGSKAKNPWDSDDLFLAYVATFLKKSEDRAENRKAGAAAKPILDHFGVGRFSEISPDDRKEACGYFATLIDALEADGYDDLADVDLGFANEGGGDDDMI